MRILGNEAANLAASEISYPLFHTTISEYSINDSLIIITYKINISWQDYWSNMDHRNKLKKVEKSVLKWIPYLNITRLESLTTPKNKDRPYTFH